MRAQASPRSGGASPMGSAPAPNRSENTSDTGASCSSAPWNSPALPVEGTAGGCSVAGTSIGGTEGGLAGTFAARCALAASST
jgi:hypothetical protein